MSEFERLLQTLQIQAAVINDLTNSINHLAEQVAESNRLVLIALAGDEDLDMPPPVYLDGSRAET